MFAILFGFMTFICVVTGMWVGAIVFGFLMALSIVGASDDKAHYIARVNRDRYWAYGEEPEWKRRKRREAERQARNGTERKRK